MQPSTRSTLPNPFILLGLDPFGPWDAAAFERAVQEKRAAWLRAQVIPGPMGEMAREHLPLLDELQRTMASAERRQALIDEARERWPQWTADREAFETRLAEAAEKGFLLESEQRALVNTFGPTLGELGIGIRVSDALGRRAAGSDDADWRDVQLQTWIVDQSLATENGAPRQPADVYRAPSPRDAIVAEPSSRLARRYPVAAHKRSRRLNVLAPFGGVVVLLVAAAAIVVHMRGGSGAPRVASAPTSTARPAETPTPRQQQQVVELTVQTRYNRWRASLSCPCDKGLDAVEIDPILLHNLHTMSKAQQQHGRWTITLRNAHVDWVRLEPPNKALLKLSANDRRVYSIAGVQKGCWDGVYSEIYTLKQLHARWMVRARRTVLRQPSCSGSTVVTPTPAATAVVVAGSPEEEVDQFLQVWDKAFGSNDASQLSTVAVDPLLSHLQSIIQSDRANSVEYKTTEVIPPTFSNLVVNGAQAKILVTRHDHVQTVNTATGKTTADENNTLVKTYTLTKINGKWIVSDRQP